MGFQNVKGTRDFYPDEMRRRNWIMETWRRASRRAGFEEYDAPIFEYLDLFTAKSGPEIAEQLFSFTDRGERNLALRPEITPSLARMVNARINAFAAADQVVLHAPAVPGGKSSEGPPEGILPVECGHHRRRFAPGRCRVCFPLRWTLFGNWA